MKINVGDYVRTKWGIARLTDITTYPCNPFKDEIEEGDATFTVYYIDTCFIPIDETRIWKEDIIKSSPNITDLIKKKDIIVDYKDNIYQVVKVWKGYVFTDKKNKYGQTITLVDYQIKSILTREQFESRQYKIGGK